MAGDTVTYNPLYLQVKDVLQKRIVDGEYKTGEIIPSESRLAEDFGTSVSTIRQALSILVAEGALKKKQGRGTFVSEKRIKISFLTWIPETRKGEGLINDLIARFEAMNPNIEVKVIPTTYTETKKKLLQLITNGNAPDVAQIVSHWTSFFASMGAFVPLEDLLESDNLKNRFEDKDLLGGTYRNSIFSVAWGLCPISMIANLNVLSEAGITHVPSPMTLDIFTEICGKISSRYGAQDKYCYGLNILHDETDFLRIYTFLQAFGGSFINDREEVVFNSRENIAAFTWLKEFLKEIKTLDTDIYAIRERFARNDVAFISDGPWIKYQMEELTGEPFDKNFKVVLNPVRFQGASVSWNYNHALAVCSQSSQRLYAARFIDTVTGDTELGNFYYQHTGHLPVFRSSLNDSRYTSEFHTGFKGQLEHSKCLNAANPMFEKAMVLCMDAVRRLLFGDADIKKELDEKEHYLNMLYYDKPS